MTCESDMADRRRFDEAKVYDPLDSFMENLGMTRM